MHEVPTFFLFSLSFNTTLLRLPSYHIVYYIFHAYTEVVFHASSLFYMSIVSYPSYYIHMTYHDVSMLLDMTILIMYIHTRFFFRLLVSSNGLGPMINTLISQCRTHFPTILPSNKVYYRVMILSTSSRPIWDFHHPTPPLEQSTLPLNRVLTSFSFGVLCSTFEDFSIYWHD